MIEVAEGVGPVARELLAYWSTLPRREFVPERRHFDPMAIVRILPVITLLERVADDDWRFRVAGTEIERRWERNLTGVPYLGIDILSPRASAAMRHEFNRVVDFPCGSWSRRAVRLQSGRGALVETLRLPLRAGDGSLSLIVSCSAESGDPIEPQADAPQEIIHITAHRFFDIGAGSPDESALDATPEG